MRTTLTIESDVARALKRKMAIGKLSLKAVVNEALRDGLGLGGAKKRQPFRVKAHSGGFKAGIDPHKINKLAGELEEEAILSKRGGP